MYVIYIINTLHSTKIYMYARLHAYTNKQSQYIYIYLNLYYTLIHTHIRVHTFMPTCTYRHIYT